MYKIQCFLSLIPLLLFGEIRVTHTIQDMLTEAAPETLLIFDIDNTICRPAQILGSDEWFFDHLHDLTATGMPQEEALNTALDIFSSIEMVTKVVPVENCVADVIRLLQKQKTACIAMTTRSPFLAHATVRQLSSIGVDMNASSPANASFRLTTMPQAEFQRGILYTNGPKKGPALKEFLRQSTYRPKRIVFIDDRHSYLDDLRFLEKEGVEYLGLHYVNENQYGCAYDKKIAQRQLEIFSTIISDSHAKALNDLDQQQDP